MKEFDYRDREKHHNINMKLRKDRKRNKEQSTNIDTKYTQLQIQKNKITRKNTKKNKDTHGKRIFYLT
jgi:hypothetical protein